MSNYTKIWLSSPHMGGDELPYIREAFETNWISPVGPHIVSFEKELAEYNNVEYCAALNSGTSAIHLALITLDVRPGDEVLCSTFTFSGSCNPIAYCGATPVFIDSEESTWNMDPSLLEQAIKERIKKGKRPKAVIAVHLYGMPAQMKEILQVTRKYEIPVIEDAAEALGSKYFGQKVGTMGDLGIFSFNGNKIITTSGGGAVISSNEEWIKNIKFLSTQARDPAPHYQHSKIGYNYRMSNICAGIGRGQLKVLDDRVEQRRRNYNFYYNQFGGIYHFLDEPEGFYSNRWLTTVVFENQAVREAIRLKLESKNIESRPLWKPMHLQPVFKDYPSYINGVSERLFSNGLCLPSGSNLSEDDLLRVAEGIKSTTVESMKSNN